MGLDFAIDALYETGWSSAEARETRRHADGRAYPTEPLVRAFFAEQGYTLSVRHIQLFDCHRAEWTSESGQPQGAVVGQTADEAAVFAMSQLRRQLVASRD